MYIQLEGVGTVHLQTVKAARVVPGAERHKWNAKEKRGTTRTCLRCGCLSIYQLNYYTFFRATPTSLLVQQRPPCHLATPAA